MSTVDTTNPALKADILGDVLDEPQPRQALARIANKHGVQLHELKRIIDLAGYPARGRMLASRTRLLDEAGIRPFAEDDDEDENEPTGEQPDTPAEPAPAGELVDVETHRLRPDPDNPREQVSDVEDLAASITGAGLLQPVVARRDGAHLVIVAGHRRLATVRHLGWRTVPCIIRDSMRPDDVLAAMLIENGQRVDLDPIEEARGFNRLKALDHLTDAELAAKVGRHQPYVSSRLALLNLTPAQQAEYRAGNMTLLEASHHGRLNAGKVSKPGPRRHWHLGPEHDLATKAKARCLRLQHPRSGTVGGMACGDCWETVIRADERQQLHDQSARQQSCVLCSTRTATKDV